MKFKINKEKTAFKIMKKNNIHYYISIVCIKNHIHYYVKSMTYNKRLFRGKQIYYSSILYKDMKIIDI